MQEVILKHKEQFQKVLSEYKISDHALKILNDIEYVVFIGPAAAGRNTIINELVAHHDFKQLVSDTTRPPKVRDGKLEVHGVNYFFRSEEDMLSDLENGEFLEAELIHNQQVSGTSIRELENAQKEGKVAVNEIEFGGAMNLLAAKPNLKVIAILPPSFDIWQQRFEKREKITPTELRNRLETAKKVIELIRREPRVRVVVNHEYHTAAKEIADYVHGVPQTDEQRADVGAVLDDFEYNIEMLLNK